MNYTFTINGKTYKAKELTYNFMCEMEEHGVQIYDIDKKPMSLGREYFALCAGVDSETAGAEIEQHIIGGGDLSGLYEALAESVNESGFFKAMANQGKAEVTAIPKKKEK